MQMSEILPAGSNADGQASSVVTILEEETFMFIGDFGGSGQSPHFAMDARKTGGTTWSVVSEVIVREPGAVNIRLTDCEVRWRLVGMGATTAVSIEAGA